MKRVQVKVIKGTLGYWDGVKVIPKTAKDEAFPMDQERASQLAKQGIVQIIESTSTEEKELADMTVDELKALADAYAIEYKSNIRRADLVALIEEAEQNDEAGEAEPDEEPPGFDPADAVQ